MARPDPTLLDPARYPWSLETTTRFADVDPNLHLNNVALAAMMEDARVRFNLALGEQIGGGQIKVGQRRAMVASVAMEYLAQGHFPEPVSVHCAIERIGHASWTIAQLLVQAGRAVAFARSVIVAIADDRPAPVDPGYRAVLGEWSLRA